MKFRSMSPILLLLTIIFFSNCSDASLQPIELTGEVTLSHDSENLSAPALEAGTYQGATRFTGVTAENVSGGKLIKVQYYMFDIPDSCFIKIYDGGTENQPGNLVYQANVSNDLVLDSWNTHELTTPATMSGNDIWVCVQFTQGTEQQILGCDPGPAKENGDWLFSSSDNQWIPLSQRTNISINWNVRAVVDMD